MNQIHGRTLRITYNDKSSSFQKLLEKDNSVTNEIEIEIVTNEIFMNKILVERNYNYDLRGNKLSEIWHLKSFLFSPQNI